MENTWGHCEHAFLLCQRVDDSFEEVEADANAHQRKRSQGIFAFRPDVYQQISIALFNGSEAFHCLKIDRGSKPSSAVIILASHKKSEPSSVKHPALRL